MSLNEVMRKLADRESSRLPKLNLRLPEPHNPAIQAVWKALAPVIAPPPSGAALVLQKVAGQLQRQWGGGLFEKKEPGPKDAPAVQAPPAPPAKPAGPEGGKRKGRDELNVQARKYLYKHRGRERNPCTRVTANELATALGCGLRIISKLPIWNALQDKRRAQGTARGPKIQALSRQGEEKAVYTNWEKDEMQQRHQEDDASANPKQVKASDKERDEMLARQVAEQDKDKAEEEGRMRPVSRRRGQN
jgi:hypothetical protein